MSKAAKNLIIELGEELSKEKEAAFDLWTYLPSYRETEKHHGDYASEFTPSVRDVMIEASIFLSHKMAPTKEQIEEAGDYYRCACGESHEIDPEA